MLIVDRIVGGGGRSFPFLVCMSRRGIRGGSCGLGVSGRRPRGGIITVDIFIIVVVDDDDFFREAILVKVIPVGVSLPRAARRHIGLWRGGIGGRQRRQLRCLSRVCGGCSSAQVGIGGAVGITVVEGIGYSAGAIRELAI